MKKQVTARAHTNIALIKYWGKKDEKLILPMNSSLSLTLNAFYTDTTVITSDGKNDEFYLNDQLQSPAATQPIKQFIDLFRNQAQDERPLKIISVNHVPTAAGLASSASAFAALGGALNEYYHFRFAPSKLSTYIRQGSGSATRSVYGGFVEWRKGTDSDSSMAVLVNDADWDIGMLTAIIDSKKKKISSREGMKRTVETSPFYSAWTKSAESDLKAIKLAIRQQNFQKLGEITEYNAMKMHATTLGANPPFSYWLPESLALMETIKNLRKEGLACYFTIDAGPNIKILCRKSEMEFIKKRMEKTFPSIPFISSTVGSGVCIR